MARYAIETGSYSLKFLILLLAILVVACESSEEKAERLRLEGLYALDDTKVAQGFLKRHNGGGSAYGKEYLDIKRECAKEELKEKGKWCKKMAEIDVVYRGLLSESVEKSLNASKINRW